MTGCPCAASNGLRLHALSGRCATSTCRCTTTSKGSRLPPETFAAHVGRRWRNEKQRARMRPKIYRSQALRPSRLIHHADSQMRSGVRRSTGAAPNRARATSRQRGAHFGPRWCASNRATAASARPTSTLPRISAPQAHPSCSVSRMGARGSTPHGIPGVMRLRQRLASHWISVDAPTARRPRLR